MRVGIIQSCYLPWRGYFDFIASVDLFILFDDVPYPQGSGKWHNRNRLKTANGLKWMTVPVATKGSPPIDRVQIVEQRKPWEQAHRNIIRESLSVSPWFEDAQSIWEHGIIGHDGNLSRLNRQLLTATCDYLGIKTEFANGRDFAVSGTKTDRLINLLNAVGGTNYLSGPTARDYLDESKFRDHGFRLEYKSYDYPTYPQAWGEFEPAVSILDLIANVGPDSMKYIRSQSPDQVAVA